MIEGHESARLPVYDTPSNTKKCLYMHSGTNDKSTRSSKNLANLNP